VVVLAQGHIPLCLSPDIPARSSVCAAATKTRDPCGDQCGLFEGLCAGCGQSENLSLRGTGRRGNVEPMK
jgi:hypothetical protein